VRITRLRNILFIALILCLPHAIEGQDYTLLSPSVIIPSDDSILNRPIDYAMSDGDTLYIVDPGDKAVYAAVTDIGVHAGWAVFPDFSAINSARRNGCP